MLAVVLLVSVLAEPAQAQLSTCPAPPRAARAPAARVAAAPRGGCLARPANKCLKRKGTLCDRDLEIAKIAWKYFENNYHASTGFVNSVNKYESTTMWDLASSLAATIAANQLGLIDDREFDTRVMKMLTSLGTMPLYRDEAPNKAYHAEKLAMVDYGNKPTDFGIGYSALDLARLGTWLDNLSCLYPRHATAAASATHRWNYCRMINDGLMFGAGYNKNTNNESLNQEGRTGYEQYGARNWAQMGFDMSISGSYKNPFTSSVEIEGVRIPIDTRDPRKLGAFNYVVTESYALEAMEYGSTAESAPLLKAIYEVQRRRWQRTGIVTAVSEDNVDRQPYFVYNTIYAAGSPWNTITDTGKDMDHLKSTSVKAAMSLAVLFPNDPYSQVLFDKVATAYDPEKGWYSGVFEGMLGYNTAVTANTNGIILEAMMYKLYGPLNAVCQKCGHSWAFQRLDGENADTERKQCFPQSRGCTRCNEPRKLTPLPAKVAAKPSSAAKPAPKAVSAPAKPPASKPAASTPAASKAPARGPAASTPAGKAPAKKPTGPAATGPTPPRPNGARVGQAPPTRPAAKSLPPRSSSSPPATMVTGPVTCCAGISNPAMASVGPIPATAKINPEPVQSTAGRP